MKPIAIIGMGGLFPQARNIAEYWNNILQQKDCLIEVPASRWNVEDYYDPDPNAPDKTYCKRGGFIPDVAFDPIEFGIPPNILEVTEVAQLLALLVTKSTLADAGYIADNRPTRSFDRETTGIILGVGSEQKLIAPLTARLQYPIWEQVLQSHGIPEEISQSIIQTMQKAYVGWEENAFPGILGNVIAGRVANRFDLGGTNCVVDAACSSSLGAVKLAMSELQEGRSSMMLAGGVNMDSSIFTYLCFSKTQAFSPDSCVRPFDAEAQGTVIGEGLGMVLLKRLEDAQRDGDRIYAVIRGIGSSSDGRFNSIYAPRAEGQVLALQRAYDDAEIAPRTVGLIEAHGTGTSAGDLAEFTALKTVFGSKSDAIQSIALGSVKSQIGHTRSAAGIAGLIKSVLALYHRTLPPMINLRRPNPQLEVESTPFEFNLESRPWAASPDFPRRAGVSAFGFGGTNFHIVLEESGHSSPDAILPNHPLESNTEESATKSTNKSNTTILLRGSNYVSDDTRSAFEMALASAKRWNDSVSAFRSPLPSVQTPDPSNPKTATPALTSLTPTSLTSATSTPTSTPTSPTPISPAPEQPLSAAFLHEQILKIVSEKTGYLAELLDMDMDIEADLGIDSIKRVEIAGALQQTFPELPQVDVDDLAEFRTLREMAEYLSVPSIPLTTPPPRIQQVRIQHLPAPDRLDFLQSSNRVSLITDDGTLLTPLLALHWKQQGKPIVILRFSQVTADPSVPYPQEVPLIALETSSESSLQQALQTIYQLYGEIGSVLHLHPSLDQSIEAPRLGFQQSREIVKQVYLLAKLLKTELHHHLLEMGRPAFVTVMRMDGALGFKQPSQDPTTSGLLGLIKSLHREWPQVFCRAIDLGFDHTSVQSKEIVVNEFTDSDLRIAMVAYGPLRSTLVPHPLPMEMQESSEVSSIPLNSVFLVSGGGGGVVSLCIRQLVSAVPCTFLLVGRTPLEEAEPDWAIGCEDPTELKYRIVLHWQPAMQSVTGPTTLQSQIPKQEKPTPQQIDQRLNSLLTQRTIRSTLQHIQKMGGNGVYVSVDVRDIEPLRNQLQPWVDHFGPITGIIHGAGVLADGWIENTTATDWDRVVSTKVDGLDALVSCVEPKQLQQLILFSSAAGFFGNPGQSNYAVANSMLNQKASDFQQRYPDCQVLSFNWGPWDTGMVTPDLRERFRERRIEMIESVSGAKIFTDALIQRWSGPILLIGSSLEEWPSAPRESQTHRIFRRLRLADNPFLQDHKIGAYPVLPAVCAIAWMADGCEQLYPGYHFFRCCDFQVLKGIVFDESVNENYVLVIEKKPITESGTIRLHATINSSDSALPRLHYKADIELRTHIPPDREFEDRFDEESSTSIPGYQYYENGALFHGPTFQGLEQLLVCTPEQVVMQCRIPEIEEATQGQFPIRTFHPYALDIFLQSMLIWSQRFREAGSLPLQTRQLEIYHSIPSDAPILVTLSIQEASVTHVVADLVATDEQDRVLVWVGGAEVTVSSRLNKMFKQK